MKRFQFSSVTEEQEIESILKTRKKKIAKQQLTFSIIFILIVGAIILYVARKTIYTEFDGYLNTEYNNVRAVDDIFFIEAHKQVGDLVYPGDTLFSYVYVSNFTSQENVFNEPDIIVNNREWRVQYNLARQDIQVMRVRINELKRQINLESHNISFGLSSNANKLRLEKELKEAEEELKARQRKLNVMLRAAKETEQLIKNSNRYDGAIHVENMRNKELMKEMGLVRYSKAVDTAVVSKLWVPDLVTVFKKEPVIQTQSFNLHRNNLSITCLVPPSKMDKINRNSVAEIVVNNDVSFTARVKLLGTRTEEIPEHLRTRLSKERMAVVVHFALDPDQIIPFWVLVKNVPVTIRLNKFKKNEQLRADYLYYNTSTGVITDTNTYGRPTIDLDTSDIFDTLTFND